MAAVKLETLRQLRYTARMNKLQPLPQYQTAIARWLMVCLALVALMVFIGGVTRLTESGLSIVEWKLVSGTVPPLTQEAWEAEFEAYKATPQYQQVNRDFTLSDFQGIFWLEYIHRLLGRIIGLTVVIPLIYFAAKKMLPRALLFRGIAIATLIGAQGGVGWIMVASGLNHEPRVEPIKLATHLLLAFAVFALMLWTRWQVLGHARTLLTSTSRNAANSLSQREKRVGVRASLTPSVQNNASHLTSPLQGEELPCSTTRSLSCIAWSTRAVLALLILQIFFGALVAGLRAGLTYNTYPLMDGQFIPDGLHLMNPWWLNHLESVLTVQFQHRMGAIAVAVAIIGLAFYAKSKLRETALFNWLLVAIGSQFALGVATLLTHVNLWLASTHQLLALVLLGLLVRLLYLTPLDPHQTTTK